MHKPNFKEIKGTKIKFGILLFLILALLTLWYIISSGLFASSKITATGTIEATTVKVSSGAPGFIDKIFFAEGDKVQKGDVIATVIREDLRALLAQSEAALAKAKLGYEQVSSSTKLQQINGAEASADSAYQSMQKAEADYNRFKALYNQGASSLSELERYETAFNVSKDSYKTAQSQVNNLKSSGGVSAQVAIAQTEIDRANAVVDGVNAQIKDLTLTAPIDGVVTSKNYEEGEFLSSGMAVTTLADLEKLWIRVYVTTEELPLIKLNQKVTFTVSGYSDKFEGTIMAISDKGEFTPKTVQTVHERANVVFGIKIATTSYEGILKPGMPADVEF
jgi:HlyD family secretion protein